jgi:hypothetical protein
MVKEKMVTAILDWSSIQGSGADSSRPIPGRPANLSSSRPGQNEDAASVVEEGRQGHLGFRQHSQRATRIVQANPSVLHRTPLKRH